jgi:small subunit ribosomal protein S14
MAKLGMIEREKKRQRLVFKFQKIRARLKKDLKDSIMNQEPRSQQFRLAAKFQKLPRNSAPTRLHNRCIITGRPKGFFRDFGLSRHVLREMAYEGLLPGVTKASW